MTSIGIVPTKYGFNAVLLPPYTNRWEVYAPVEIDSELELIMKSEILRRLAIYCHQLSGWQGQLRVALPWAIWGGLALWMRLSNYASMGGWKIIALYGWIMFLFFGDGIWQFGRLINQVPNLLRVWQIKRMRDVKITYHKIDWVGWKADDPNVSEREVIEMSIIANPGTKPYYDEMLRTEPPFAFSLVPLGLLGYVRYLMCGPRIPRPAIVVELGNIS